MPDTTGPAVQTQAPWLGLAVGLGVGLGHVPTTTVTVSTRHPVALTLLSDAIRKRSLIVCPFTFGPRFATVLT